LAAVLAGDGTLNELAGPALAVLFEAKGGADLARGRSVLE